jgi:hypothetical protein
MCTACYAFLQVFRCGGNGKPKGWGVRCLDDVKPGQFLGAYLGEVLQVSELAIL